MFRRIRWLALMVGRGSGDRGRRAESPLRIPLVGWRDILIRLWRNARADHLNVLAAGIAFYAFLALLPLIVSTVMIYGLVSTPEDIVQHVGKLFALVPVAAQELVTRRVVEVTTADRGGPLALLLALLITLYGGARSARSVTAALNVVYGEKDDPRFVRRWGLPLALALGGASLMLLALVAIALLGYVERLLPESTPLGWVVAKVGFWLLVASGVGAGCAALYRFGPTRRSARWIWVLPGALAATGLWLAFTFAFGLYLANFERFDRTYGSLAAVVILQFWIYLSAFILLLGAKLNTEIELQTTRDTTVGPSRRAGRRRAASADEVGEIPTIGSAPARSESREADP